MYIVAIAWLYVVLMMSITEHSVTAGIVTFLLYGVLPLAIILYLMDTPRRKRARVLREKSEEKLPEVKSSPVNSDNALGPVDQPGKPTESNKGN